jgi:acylaminoacyl-peptidase
MNACSRNQVRAPTLLALGAKDQRVPCSQGVEWHHALKARGVATRLLMYPDDSHPIDKPASEADHWINVAQWINEHL